MPGKADFLENAVLNHLLGRNSTYTPPTTLDIALYTATPGETGGGSGTEVTGGSYARKNVPNDAATWGAATTTGSKSNTAVIRFAEATASWGTVAAFALFEPGTSNMLYFGPISPTKAIAAGITAEFAVGGIVITED